MLGLISSIARAMVTLFVAVWIINKAERNRLKEQPKILDVDRNTVNSLSNPVPVLPIPGSSNENEVSSDEISKSVMNEFDMKSLNESLDRFLKQPKNYRLFAGVCC